MKLVALLSWFDESPAWLATVVAGFGRVCDEIVAVDGAYLFYPDARGRSHPEQAEAILHAAEAADVGCTIHRPREPFAGNEVEKRNLTLGFAAAHRPDWVLVCDGDYHVTRCDPESVRGALEDTELNVASYLLADSMDPLGMGPGMAATAARVEVQSQWQLATRDIFRWTDDLAYGPAHYTVSGTYNGEHLWLKGPEMLGDGSATRIEPCLDLGDRLVAVHRSKDRIQLRRQAADAYYRRRDEHGIEDLAAVNWRTA